MSNMASGSSQPLAPESSPENIAKRHFKQAWAYSERIDHESRAAIHTIELYSAKLHDTRRKLRDRCVAILLQSCTYRRKAEELLWKKGFYELAQKSKANKQALDGTSPLYHAYTDHLAAAGEFYTQLIRQLEDHYHLPITSLNHSQITTLDSGNPDVEWLRGAAYRCVLYLGDLARYRVEVGGKPYTAVTHYLHTISLDPNNGAPFNQLAALAGDKHEGLDATYYYIRSISAAKPFQGAEVNLKRVLRKTTERLDSLRGNKDRATETNIREATLSLLLVRLVTLQHMLYTSSDKDKRLNQSPAITPPPPSSVSSLCEVLLSDLEECLNFDLQLFKDMTPACVDHVLSRRRTREGEREDGEKEVEHKMVEELACFPHDLLLKVVSLCILSSIRLRNEGSVQAQTLTLFTVSIFSLLLHHSFLRLSHLTHHTLQTLTPGATGTKTTPTNPRPSCWTYTPDIHQHSEGNNMVQVFLDQISGETLDDYAQLMPQDSTKLSSSGSGAQLGESMNKLTIGPSHVWGGVSDSGSSKSEDNRVREDVKDDEGQSSSRDARFGAESSEQPVGQCVSGAATSEKKQRKKKNERGRQRGMMVDRRRRRRQRQRRPDWEMTPLSSEDEESDETSDHSRSSLSSASSQSDITTDEEDEEEEEEEEESFDRIDSLSDTSLSGGEEERGLVGGDRHQPWSSNSGTQECPKTRGKEKVEEEEKELKPKGRRQIVIAAKFSGSSLVQRGSGEEKKSMSTTDENLFQDLLLQTRQQAALHLACCLAGEDSYLMAIKIFADWLTDHPLIITLCAQNPVNLWSRLASLLNLLPPAQDIINTGLLPAAVSVGSEWTQKTALQEDTLLRGLTPLTKTQCRLQYDTTATIEPLEQACNRICVLQMFGKHLARTKTAVEFQWDSNRERFSGPQQRDRDDRRTTDSIKNKQQQKAAENRSKLMKTMAERRLQVEVENLVETSAKQEATKVFSPYLLPDAQSLCTGLHLIRKFINSEKFIVIIAKSVVDSLDSMKKGKENYAAREAIKFLERSLQGGGKMVRVQDAKETLLPSGTRKPPRMDLNTWRYKCLVDCALYFTQTFAERCSSGQMASTLLLDQGLVKLVEEARETVDGGDDSSSSSVTDVLLEAQLNGVSIDTVVRFHKRWQHQSGGTQLPSRRRRHTERK